MRMSLRRFLPTSRQRSAGADASNKVPAKSLAVRKAFWRRSNRIGGVHLTSAGRPSVVCLCERRRISQTLTQFHDAVRSPVQNGAAVRGALRAAAALCSLPWNFRNRHDRICDRRTVAGYRGKPRGQRFVDRIARQRLCARRRRWRPSGCRHHNVAVTSAKGSRSEVQNPAPICLTGHAESDPFDLCSIDQALWSAQACWTRANSKSSDIRQRRQGSIARVQFSVSVDRLNANLIGAGLQMRPEAMANRRCFAPEHHCVDESV
jgi:hypothetical protein